MQGGGRQEYTRAKHSEGRERPHFGRPSAAQTPVGSLPACHHVTVTVARVHTEMYSTLNPEMK